MRMIPAERAAASASGRNSKRSMLVSLVSGLSTPRCPRAHRRRLRRRRCPTYFPSWFGIKCRPRKRSPPPGHARQKKQRHSTTAAFEEKRMRDRTLPLHAGMALCIAMAIALAALLLAGAAGSPLHPAVPAGLAVLLMIGLAAVEVLAWKRLRQLRDRAVELRNSQLHLAALLDSIPEGLFMTDLDGRITAINKASARAMNQTPASATGKMIADLTDAETGRRLTETRLKV